MTRSQPFDHHAIRLHIGAHHGPVVAESGDMYGDTVNVAAYLCTVARAEQIIIAEATYRRLSPALKSCAQPIFRTRLKSHPEETILYQVLWKTGDLDVTMNLFNERPSAKPIPAEVGGLLLTRGGETTHLNYRRNTLVIGRSAKENPGGVIGFARDRRSLYRP
jgi:adenylate cyclase